MREYSGRFTGFVGIPLTDRGQASEEAQRYLDDLGLPGRMLEPRMRIPPTYPDDVNVCPGVTRSKRK